MTHDDVIGTRRVSYIIYFSEPTPKWEIKDGGLLELYPLAEGEAGHTQDHHSVLSGVPAVTPTACLCPAFNTMAMFVVQPGKSYHAVQEVCGRVLVLCLSYTLLGVWVSMSKDKFDCCEIGRELTKSSGGQEVQMVW